jgi:hypothetical protein
MVWSLVWRTTNTRRNFLPWRRVWKRDKPIYGGFAFLRSVPEAYRETFIFPRKALRAIGKRIEIFISSRFFSLSPL